jgi:hypothetical protein
MSSPAARAMLALVALAIAAFLAVQLVAERHLKSAAETLAGNPSPAERADALDQLDSVANLQPGTAALLAAAAARASAGQDAEAERLARRATAREPRNFAAWVALALALRHTDRAGARRALDRAGERNPLYPRPPLE